MAMLVPAKLATAAYGARARAGLTESGTLLSVADLTLVPDAAFDATTYPLAIVARATRPLPTHRPMLGLHPETRTPFGPPAQPGAPWILVPGDLHATLSRLRKHRALSQSIRIQLGVKTGANHLFLSPTPEIEQELVRPALHGRDVSAFLASPSGRIVWTHDSNGDVLSTLPPMASRHFARHSEVLHGRSDDGGSIPWTLFRASAGRPVPRVVWPDLARQLEVACLVEANEFGWIPLNSCYVVLCKSPGRAQALCAWLNSTWIRAAARATADPASGGYARFNARAVGAIPLPPESLEQEHLIALARRGGAGDDIQLELDEFVAERLGLRRQDRRNLAEVVGVGTTRRR